MSYQVYLGSFLYLHREVGKTQRDREVTKTQKSEVTKIWQMKLNQQ